MPKVEKECNVESGEAQRYFWKGKRVTEKIYKARVTAQNIGRNIRNIYGTKSRSHNLESAASSTNKITTALLSDKIDANVSPFKEIEGRRIVHLKTLGRGLSCTQCKSVLSLSDIIDEQRSGLASKLFIPCRDCKIVNTVDTDKQHTVSKQKPHYDVNTKAAIGVLDAGIGNTHLNKFLAAVNIPQLHWTTFKTHEKEIGNAVEDMTYESCKKAIEEERQLTIENYEKVKKLLYVNLRRRILFINFI